MYYVYLIKSISSPDRTYIGHTDNLSERLETHNSGGSIYTKDARPWKVVIVVHYWFLLRRNARKHS